MVDDGVWRMAKIAIYRHAMCPAQIAYSGWHIIHHDTPPRLLFFNIASKHGLI